MYGLHYSETVGWRSSHGSDPDRRDHRRGNLAWNLGHNDFTTADKAATYMGVHVMLTGIRGSIAPFVGSWLYQMPGVGRNVFGLSVLICITSLLGFMAMARKCPEAQAPSRARVKAVT